MLCVGLLLEKSTVEFVPFLILPNVIVFIISAINGHLIFT